MRKSIVFLLVMLFCAVTSFARVDSTTLTPTTTAYSSDGIKIYNTLNTGTINAISVYIVGASTTATATYEVGADSIQFTTTGGLYPGTTYFLFSETNKDTLTELLNFAVAVATSTPGVEGGIVISTGDAAYGKVLSTALTASQSGSCLGSATVTATPAGSQTSTVAIYGTSITFTSTNGLYPGSSTYTMADTNKDTIEELESWLESVAATVAGIDGTLTISITNGIYDKNLTNELTLTQATSIAGSANELSIVLDNSYGISYIFPSDIYRDSQYHITGVNVNATFSTGTTYLKIYDGTETTDIELLRYEIDTTATETPIRSIPTNGDFAGSAETSVRFDVIGSSWITAGYITIIGHKE